MQVSFEPRCWNAWRRQRNRNWCGSWAVVATGATRDECSRALYALLADREAGNGDSLVLEHGRHPNDAMPTAVRRKGAGRARPR